MPHHLVWLACVWIGTLRGPILPKGNNSGIEGLLDRQQYEKLFPHHHAIYTYEALLKAAAAFPRFAGEGTGSARKKELAAFFAHIAHETTDGWTGAKGGPYVWGL